jgi:hypothetical protein
VEVVVFLHVLPDRVPGNLPGRELLEAVHDEGPRPLADARGVGDDIGVPPVQEGPGGRGSRRAACTPLVSSRGKHSALEGSVRFVSMRRLPDPLLQRRECGRISNLPLEEGSRGPVHLRTRPCGPGNASALLLYTRPGY